jgi:hypothetical protein
VDGAGLGVDPMQHFSTWARWIATAILAAIGTITTDVVVDFIKRQPETDDAIHAGMKFLLYLAQQPWLHIVGWIFVGLVAGLWLDLVLRKLDGSRANERKMLGAEMAKYGNYLGQFGSVPDSAKINLTEQARNRDYDSSDECEQARKQHNVTQEHTHNRASPSSPLCEAHLGISKAVPATSSEAVSVDMRGLLS